MPELPEVETIVRGLQRKARGAKVVDFWTDWEPSIKMPLAQFRKEIVGREITKVMRRGKNILFFLDNGKVMLVHLKMTGHLLVKREKHDQQGYFSERVNQYIHHAWTLEKEEKKSYMEFSDLRKFGKIRLLEEIDMVNDKDIKDLGVEPLSSGFSFNKFQEIIQAHEKKTVRNILMEQGVIAGIGNIYASEILFEAGIFPAKKANDLDEAKSKEIYRAIIRVLTKAVELRGTSDSDYRDIDGAPGGFQKVLNVYNREGQVCKRNGCKGLVRRMKLNGRSAFYCESCQT